MKNPVALRSAPLSVDIGVILVLAVAVLAPWLVGLARAPAALAWPVFIGIVALLVMLLLDEVHLWVPSGIGQPLSWTLAIAILIRLATEFFPRDRANRP